MPDEMPDICQKILNFYSQLERDANHRYKSWEHCYAYFCKENAKPDEACLHLAFYLASWGMYRGSSFLLWKDYLIHKKVVCYLLKNRKKLQGLDPSSATKENFTEIFDLILRIRNWYQENIKSVNGATRSINVTDTLVTKIILGTLGCVPAYDRFFIDGIRKKGLHYAKINSVNFESLMQYYRDNKDQFSAAANEILNKSGVAYPAMKLVDMYFWEIGFEINQNNQKPSNLKRTTSSANSDAFKS